MITLLVPTGKCGGGQNSHKPKHNNNKEELHGDVVAYFQLRPEHRIACARDALPISKNLLAFSKQMDYYWFEQ
jgi:hypothetical protein